MFMRDLALLIRSRHPIIFIETEEKDRVQSLLMHLADQQKLPFYVWTRSRGLKHHFELASAKAQSERAPQFAGMSAPTVLESPHQATLEPLSALSEVQQRKQRAIYNFQGLSHDLDKPIVASKLRDAARQFMEHEGSIIISGDVPSELPTTIRSLCTVLQLPTPAQHEYQQLVERLYRDLARRHPIELHIGRAELQQLSRNLQGLTLLEAEKILTRLMIEDMRLGPDDIRRISEAKKSIIERDGLLEYYPTEDSLDDVAGFAGLKTWLARRRAIIQKPEQAREFGLEFPKGILLLGVQGSGKSLCAKAVASDWGLPLLKMDPASLYNKYIGETERNFRRATQAAERMAPVVLWLDEIEKAFAGQGDTDSGVSRRVLGNFLGWLQERKGDVFVVATANDVSQLPPELIRKGRFDEIFFVDLPNEASRARILEVHLRKRKRKPEAFDVALLAQRSVGFSGAELEQVVVAGLYAAFAEGLELSSEILLQELQQTVPLSRTMSEKLQNLRDWAQGRAVPVD